MTLYQRLGALCTTARTRPFMSTTGIPRVGAIVSWFIGAIYLYLHVSNDGGPIPHSVNMQSFG